MAHKGGLGKGLGALIPGQNDMAQGSLLSLPIDRILPNPRQPRSEMDPAELQSLSDSIREHGILQPLVVTIEPGSDFYILIAGERRLRAATLAGLEMVPAIVRQVTDQQRLELALIENVQRADLSALEKAEAYLLLKDEFGLKEDEIAQRVGKDRTTVSNTIGLLRLAEDVKQALREGKISEGHARSINSLEHPQAQSGVLKTVLENDLSVRQTEALVKKLKGDRPARRVANGPSAEVREIEERLRSQLGTRVTLRHGKEGGSLTIYYFSDEELDSLIGQILKED